VPDPDANARAFLALTAITQRRHRLALVLTAIMMVIYFGFILLVAFDKPLLGTLLAPGLSLGIAVGAAVIIAAWVVTGVYVSWANRHYDHVVTTARMAGPEVGAGGAEPGALAAAASGPGPVALDEPATGPNEAGAAGAGGGDSK